MEENQTNNELLQQILKEVRELREMVDTFNSTKVENNIEQSNSFRKTKTYAKNIGNIQELLNNRFFY